MRYIPHTEHDIQAMLAVLGVDSVEDLIRHLPEDLRQNASLDLAPGLAESEITQRLSAFAEQQTGYGPERSFLGAGAYAHLVPVVVDQIVQRAEFATAYTPYQPEVSQGTLQVIFEFQSLVASLLGLEVANASMYDGASATAEAVLMAKRILPKRSRVLIARSLHPQYRQVIRTYLDGFPGLSRVELGWDEAGRLDQAALAQHLDERVCGVVVGYPNVFGVVEDIATVSRIAQNAGALTLSVTPESVALGILKSPGELGADIAVAEGQSLGIPLSYGGPGLGLFACRSRHVRNMPGRLVGETVDQDGRSGFVLTLATREQHIRRERATSNICTNHGLCALAATVFLCLLGKQGLRELALRNVKSSHYLAEVMQQTAGVQTRFPSPFFNECVLTVPHARSVWARLKEQGVIAGIVLEDWYEELHDCLLVCATELHTREAIERFGQQLRQTATLTQVA